MTELLSEISSRLHLGRGEGGLGARIQTLAVSWSQGGENAGGSCSFRSRLELPPLLRPASSRNASQTGPCAQGAEKQAPTPSRSPAHTHQPHTTSPSWGQI